MILKLLKFTSSVSFQRVAQYERRKDISLICHLVFPVALECHTRCQFSYISWLPLLALELPHRDVLRNCMSLHGKHHEVRVQRHVVTCTRIFKN